MATIKDIALLANVSTTTVSRVLNNDQSFSVSEITRSKSDCSCQAAGI